MGLLGLLIVSLCRPALGGTVPVSPGLFPTTRSRLCWVISPTVAAGSSQVPFGVRMLAGEQLPCAAKLTGRPALHTPHLFQCMWGWSANHALLGLLGGASQPLAGTRGETQVGTRSSEPPEPGLQTAMRGSAHGCHKLQPRAMVGRVTCVR